MPADSITLSHLRRALDRAPTHPENAAIVRLPESERTVEGLARAYLSRDLWLTFADGPWRTLSAVKYATAHPRDLDLTDPGTCHAVLVALALALGLDPGPAGLCAAWRPLRAGSTLPAPRCGWWLSTVDEAVYYVTAADTTGDDDEIVSDAIASEPDPIKALAAALLHTVETPDAR